MSNESSATFFIAPNIYFLLHFPSHDHRSQSWTFFDIIYWNVLACTMHYKCSIREFACVNRGAHDTPQPFEFHLAKVPSPHRCTQKKGDWQKMEISFYFYDNLIDAHISTLFLFASLKLRIFSNIWIQFKILIKLLLKWRTAPRVAKVANKQSLILSIVWYNHLIYLLLRINSATIKCEWNAN